MTSTDHLWFQCRHILNLKESWTKNDGAGFNAKKFYLNIISLFEDDDVWVEETLIGGMSAYIIIIITQTLSDVEIQLRIW
jgi:hypothetical protein